MKFKKAAIFVLAGLILCAIGIFLIFRVIEATPGMIFCIVLLAIASMLIQIGVIGGIVGMSLRAQEKRMEKYDREHPKEK